MEKIVHGFGCRPAGWGKIRHCFFNGWSSLPKWEMGSGERVLDLGFLTIESLLLTWLWGGWKWGYSSNPLFPLLSRVNRRCLSLRKLLVFPDALTLVPCIIFLTLVIPYSGACAHFRGLPFWKLSINAALAHFLGSFRFIIVHKVQLFTFGFFHILDCPRASRPFSG